MILTFEALSVLHWFSEQPEGDHHIPDDVCPEKYHAGIYHELVDNQLIISEERLGGGYSFQISPRSYAAVDRLARRYRQGAIQLWILQRVAAAPDQGAASEHFPPEGVQGEPVSAGEYEQAVERLVSEKLISGFQTLGGELVRPEVTTTGQDVLESGLTPADWKSRQSGTSSTTTYGDSNTMTISGGNVGAAQQGYANTANVTQTISMDLEAYNAAMGHLRDILASALLSGETRQAAMDQLDLVDETAKTGGSRQRIQGLLHMFTAALPAALATDASGLVFDLLAAIPQ
ncbi:hypothetical protein [Arthrobacter sp.]|uniref:hypothetical protein n=1 Tax=Arthrobacter sp. TaxID=1667 RepID=UPI003A953B01